MGGRSERAGFSGKPWNVINTCGMSERMSHKTEDLCFEGFGIRMSYVHTCVEFTSLLRSYSWLSYLSPITAL